MPEADAAVYTDRAWTVLAGPVPRSFVVTALPERVRGEHLPELFVAVQVMQYGSSALPIDLGHTEPSVITMPG